LGKGGTARIDKVGFRAKLPRLGDRGSVQRGRREVFIRPTRTRIGLRGGGAPKKNQGSKKKKIQVVDVDKDGVRLDAVEVKDPGKTKMGAYGSWEMVKYHTKCRSEYGGLEGPPRKNLWGGLLLLL